MVRRPSARGEDNDIVKPSNNKPGGEASVRKAGFEFEYEWEPFTCAGTHLTFDAHRTTRLDARTCSHWGPAIYKWEGGIHEGPHAGGTGVLIGETGDLRQRIKQYVHGTQKSGNAYWRETFLTKGDIHLYVLRLGDTVCEVAPRVSVTLPSDPTASGNLRLIYEQILVLEQSTRGEDVWIVNKNL